MPVFKHKVDGTDQLNTDRSLDLVAGAGVDLTAIPPDGVQIDVDLSELDLTAYVQKATASITGTLALTGDISPTQLAANTDDWAPTGLSGASVIRASTDASRNLTGLTGGADGRVIALANVGAQALVIKHDVTSTAANRFYCPGNADVTLAANTTVLIQYDSTSSRWRVIGAPGVTDHGALTGLTDDDHPYILESLADAAGDILVASADDTWAKLAKGSDGEVLSMVGGSVDWNTVPIGNFRPNAGNSALGWSFDSIQNSGTQTQSGMEAAGWHHYVRIEWPVTRTVSNITVYVSTAGVGLTSGQCFAVIYGSDGTRLAYTADQSGVWNSTGLKTMALATPSSSVSIPSSGPTDFIWVALYYSLTPGTIPRFFGNVAISFGSAPVLNMGCSNAQSRVAKQNIGDTTTPSASITPASMTQDFNHYWAVLT